MAIGLTWAAGEASVGWFAPEATGRPELGPQRGTIAPEAVHRAVLKNAALAYGLQGAILGAILGAGGAAARGFGSGRRSGRRSRGCSWARVLGAAVSYGAFIVVAPWSGFGSQEMLPDLLGHAASWSVVGASAVLPSGWGPRGSQPGRPWRSRAG